MKKIPEFIKKHDNIFMLIFIIIITTTFSYYRQLAASDELWNFSNIYKMYNGYTIYKDTNVIITPLYFWIGKILFSLLGANYLVFRTYQAPIPYTILLFIIYNIFKKIGIKKGTSAIYTSIIGIIYSFRLVEASYNIQAIAFVMLGIYYLIKNKTLKKQIISQSIIVVLIFLTKQNIGIYYLIGLIIYQLILEKEKIGIKIKTILAEVTAILGLLLIFYIYMQTRGIWGDFINYAFSGISEFAIKNITKNMVNEQYIAQKVILIIVSIIPSIILIITNIIPLIIIKKFKVQLSKEQNRNIKILATFAIIMQMISYPIFNDAHRLMASINQIVYICYIINIIIKTILKDEPLEKIEKIEKKKKIIIIIIIALITSCNIYINSQYLKQILGSNYYFEKNSPYYGAIITKERQEEIEEIINYIKQQNQKGIEVKIISYHSNLYMNLLNRNNGAFDLPFYGNMGRAGENGMIGEIQKLENTKILVLTEDDKKYQESLKVISYIKNNLKYEGTIQQFSIYSTE